MVGKLADLVLWKPAFFGVKPELVLKGGMIALANMGDPNASIPTPQPTFYRPMFASHGKARARTCVTFVSAVSLEEGLADELTVEKSLVAVSGTREVGKADMLFNEQTPEIEIDPETYRVTADGEDLVCEPLDVVPLAQRYFLF